MDRKSVTPYSLGAGFVQDRGTMRVIAQIDELADAGDMSSQIMKWVAKGGKWSQFSLDWSAVRIWVTSDPLELSVLGPDGEVLIGSPSGDKREFADDTVHGPRGRGPLRDLRQIGHHLYAVGMSRQVYRREAVDVWRHRDDGAVLPLGSKSVSGFNSIDGLTEEDLYAVGFAGEIWRCLKGVWHQVESPTNVVLNRVRAIRENLAYACGQEGVLLRGSGDAWEQIDHGATDDDFWDIEWYAGQLYVAYEDGLFLLARGEELEAVDFGISGTITCRHLHANDGVLLSSGPKSVLWTSDGTKWNDITP